MPPKKRDLLQQLRIPDNRIYSSIGHEVNLNRSERRRLKPASHSMDSYMLDESTRHSNGIANNRKNRNSTLQGHGYNSDSISVVPSGQTNVNASATMVRHSNNHLSISIHYSTKYKEFFKTIDPEYDFRDLPYKGILPYPDCIINNTDPTKHDRDIFEKFHKQGDVLRISNQNMPSYEDNESSTYLKSQIKKIRFRQYDIDTWYTAPYPEEYSQSKILYICEHCLKYMNSPFSYDRHRLKNCNMANKRPPGLEIYRDDTRKIAFWEVDGRKNIGYCQNLCLLAKLFLNSKTLYYDVEPFIFYILTEIDKDDPSIYHFVGYFSKEKLNSSDYNVSCILTLPIYQRKGYGNLLIDFSYLLSRNEFKFGTPEKPLSDLGLLSYRNYWKLSMAYKLKALYDRYGLGIRITIENLSKLSGMTPSDVVIGLEQLNALVKNPINKSYGIVINLQVIDEVISKFESKNYVQLDYSKLLWKPMLFGPSGGINSTPAVIQASNIMPSNSNGAVSIAINNSIGLLSSFLKDDIDNPYSFEEEAYKEIEVLKDARDDSPIEDISEFVICHPDGPIETTFDKKMANMGDSIEEVNTDQEQDSESEEYLDTIDRTGRQAIDEDSDEDVEIYDDDVDEDEDEVIEEVEDEDEEMEYDDIESEGDDDEDNENANHDENTEVGIESNFLSRRSRFGGKNIRASQNISTSRRLRNKV